MNEIEKVPNPYAKKEKIAMSIIVAMILFSGIYLFWDNFMGVQPDIKIYDTQISMRNTAQDLLDTGFVLCDDQGKIVNPMDLTLTGRQIYDTYYFIGIPHEGGTASYCDSSGVAITVANFSSSDKMFRDCAIYQMAYYPYYHDSAVKVLVNGVDLSEASFDAWLEFFETAGYPFKKDELEEFRRGDTQFLLGTRGRYKFQVDMETDYNEETGDWTDFGIFSLTFTRNINVTYKYE